MQDAEALYQGDVVLFPEFTRRCLFIAGLPVEVQAYITTQRKIQWDDPYLSTAAVTALYRMAEEEFDLREKRGQPLTKQAHFSRYPTGILSHRTTKVIDANALEAEAAPADLLGCRNYAGSAFGIMTDFPGFLAF